MILPKVRLSHISLSPSSPPSSSSPSPKPQMLCHTSDDCNASLVIRRTPVSGSLTMPSTESLTPCAATYWTVSQLSWPGIPQTCSVWPVLMMEHLCLVRAPTSIFGLGCCSPFLIQASSER